MDTRLTGPKDIMEVLEHINFIPDLRNKIGPIKSAPGKILTATVL